MKTGILSKVALLSGLILVCSTWLFTAYGEEWPTQPMVIVVPAAPGGGFDLMGRGIAQHLSQELGVPISVVNRPGAATMLGTQYFLQQPQDGHTMMIAGPAPYFASHAEMGADYTLDDFAILNLQWPDYTGAFARSDLLLDNLPDVLEDIRQNSGKYSIGIVPNSTAHINLVLLFEAMDIPLDNLRIVEYTTNGQIRPPLIGGQIDLALTPFDATTEIIDQVKPLAIFAEERSETHSEVPTAQEALDAHDITLPVVPDSMRSLVVSSEFRENYPDRYARLVEAYEAVATSESFRNSMSELGVGHEWHGPEESTRLVENAYRAVVTYQGVLDDYR